MAGDDEGGDVVSKVVIDGAGRFSCHYPFLAIIVTAHAKGRENAMAVGWHSPISSKPPLYGIAIVSKRFTYELIVESGEFAINFVPLEMAEVVASVGGVSGHQIDKFEHFAIAKEEAAKTSAPLLKDAYACYECKVVDNRPCGDHQWVVGEVVASHFSQQYFSAAGEMDVNAAKPTLYTGSERYITTQAESLRHLDRKLHGQGRKD